MPPPSRRPEPRRGSRRRRGRHVRRRTGTILGVLLLTLPVLVTGVLLRAASQGDEAPRVSHRPPPAAGYFRTVPAGSWSQLPDDAACSDRVRRSTWEPRPENQQPNQTVPNRRAVRAALSTRPRDGAANGYDPRFDSWLLARVTGGHTGTTDENIQWAACKWGLPDNLLRAIAVRESTWYQDVRYASGRCVPNNGCGDMVDAPTAATGVFCRGISRSGHDYEQDYGSGVCPRTFSIVGVMAWQNPDWGPMAGNQNGTFPFSRDSTAFALDYLGSFLRGCFEGWVPWLANTGDRSYAAGDLRGCVGAWYAGEWRSPLAMGYIGRVKDEEDARTWLSTEFRLHDPPCSPTYGCPRLSGRPG
jgi:hypothetical protein